MNNLKTFARLGIVYFEEVDLMAKGDEALKAWEISRRLGIRAYAEYSNRHYAIVHGIPRKLTDTERVKRYSNPVVGAHWIQMEDI
ncbi:hypothetical protein J5I95_00430 [Candidatus Poribacteria bacterium]|nr:hypothetical protein [Candidatus Poribacteria bacterium]